MDTDTTKDIDEGSRVLYIPGHAHGKRDHPDCERGTVWRFSVGRSIAFVLYDGDMAPKATTPSDLRAL